MTICIKKEKKKKDTLILIDCKFSDLDMFICSCYSLVVLKNVGERSFCYINLLMSLGYFGCIDCE